MTNKPVTSLWPRKIRRWPRTALAVALLAALAGALFLALPRADGGAQVEVVEEDRPLRAGSGLVFDSAGSGAPGGRPRAALSDDFYDFGALGPRDVASREFLLTNAGADPLVITRAYTTCGCTAGEISAAVIPPGKAARVKVTFDAGLHPTPGQTVRRGLILETNDPDRPQLEIWVQATVRK